MAKITTEQILKINRMCSNNWRFDIQYFIYHSEKTLRKQIDLNEQSYLEFTLRYNSQNQIVLHISKFYHEKGGNYTSTSGLGKNRILEETEAKRKNVNDLIRLTKTLTDEELVEINKHTKVAPGYGLIMKSEDF